MLCSNLNMEENFPETIKILQQLMGQSFGEFWQKIKGLRTDEVPMVIRAEGLGDFVSELSHYESIKAFVMNEDMGNPDFKLAKRRINPSVQWIYLSVAAPQLMKTPGLYLLWRKGSQFHEMLITERQAQILDQLMDDQISEFDREEETEIQKMLSLGVVLELGRERL